MIDNVQKIAQLLETNAEAEAALKKAATVDEAVATLCHYGVDITAEEFVQIGREVTSGELSEDMLMMVSGGSWKGFWSGLRDFFQGFLDAF